MQFKDRIGKSKTNSYPITSSTSSAIKPFKKVRYIIWIKSCSFIPNPDLYIKRIAGIITMYSSAGL